MLNMKGILAKLFSAVLALGMVIQPVTPLTSPIIVFAEGEDADPANTPAPTPTTGTETGGETPDPTNSPEPTPASTPIALSNPDESSKLLAASYENGVITISATEYGTGRDFDFAGFFKDYDLMVSAMVTSYDATGTPSSSQVKSVMFTENTDTATADIADLVDSGTYASISDFSVTLSSNEPDIVLKAEDVDLSVLQSDEVKNVVVDKRTTTVSDFKASKEGGYSFSATVSNPKYGYHYSLRLENKNGVAVATSDPFGCTNPFRPLTLSLNSGFAFDTEYTPVIVSEEEGKIVTGTTQLSITSPKYKSISWMNDATSGIKYAEVIFNEEVFGTVALTLNQTANDVTKPFTISGSKNPESTTPNSYLFELTDVSGQDTSLVSYGAGTTYSFYDDDNTTQAVNVVLTAYEGYDYEVAGSENAVVSSGQSFIDTFAPVVTDFDLSVGDDAIDNNATVNSDVTLSVKFNETVKLDNTENWYTVKTASGEVATEDNTAVLTGSSDGRTYTVKFSGNETDLTGLIYTIGSFTVKDDAGLSVTADINKTFTIDKVSPTVTVKNEGNLNNEFVKGNVNFTVSTDEALADTLTVGYTYTTNEGDVTASKTFSANADGTYSVVLGDEAVSSAIIYKNITLSGEDAAGNEINVDADTLTDKEITLDNAAPDVVFDSLEVYNAAGDKVDNADNIANGKAVYTVLISDAGSGIDETKFVFQIDSNVIQASDYEISKDENGNYTVTIEAPAKAEQNVTLSATDKVGNTFSNSYNSPFLIESDAPTIGIDTNGESAEKLETAEQSHVVSFKVTDYTMEEPGKSLSSNLYSVEYWLTKGDAQVEFKNGDTVVSDSGYTAYPFEGEIDELSGSISIQSSENNSLNGTYVLHIKATDKALNSEEFTQDVVFDNTCPELSISHAEGEENKALKDHTFTYSVGETTEDNSGIVSITYALYDSNDPVTRRPVQIKDTNGDYVDYIKLPMADPDADTGSITIFGKEEGHLINGKKYLVVTAIDTAGNTTEEKTLEMLFDNTVPTVDSVTPDNEEAKKNHTFTVKASDLPIDAASGVSTISFTLIDADGDEVPVVYGPNTEAQITNTIAYDASLDAEGASGNQIIINGEENELNGVYSLVVYATDSVGYDSGEITVENIRFDNTAPEIDEFTIDTATPEQTHTFTLDATDYPETAASGVASITYILTNDKNEAVPIKQSETAEASTKNVVEYNADGSATSFVIDGNLNKLDGVYTLSAIVTDKVEYKSVAKEVKTVEFDTTPLEVNIAIETEGKLSFYDGDNTESGNAEVYSNEEVTVTVTATDNFPITNENELYATVNGIESVSGNHFLVVSEDDKVASATFTYGVSGNNTEDVIETIRNTLKYTGIDAAKNGANVTVEYIDSTSDTAVKTFEDNVLDVNATEYAVPYQTVVDMVAPEYTMDITNPDVADSVYNNRVYYGSTTKNQMAPTVTIDEGNFYTDDYEIATLYSDGGTASYEDADVNPEEISWASVTGKENAFVTTVDGNDRPDGVYRFAVRGTDKAGNELVPSEAEKTKTTAEPEKATELIAGTAETNDYWTNVKVVDTKIDLYLGISDPDAESAYFEYSTQNGRNASYLYRQVQIADIVVSANVDDIVEKSPTKISMNIESSNSAASGPVEISFGYEDLEHSLPKADQKFLIKDVTVTDRAGNSVTYSMAVGDTIYLDVTNPDHTIDITAPSISVRAETPITIRNTEDNRPLFNSAVSLKVDVNDPNPDYCSGVKYVTYTLYADGNLIFTQTRNAGDSHYSDRATFSEVVVADPNVYAALETNNIELVVTAEDNSGNSIEDRETFGIDTVAPVVEISFDNNSAQHDKYFKENRVATVKITDRNINTEMIDVHTSVAHSGFSAIQNGGGNGANDYRTFTIPYTADGDYTLNITGTDALGNRFERPIFVDGTVAGSEFTIDKTAPVINVSFNNNDVRNGKYYNAGRVATVTIDEHNFLADEVRIDQTASIQRGSTGTPAPSGFGTNGDSHSASINYSADGNYTLRVNYTDMAGNVAQEVVVDEFTIDTTKPVVRFDDNTVTDNMATNGVIAPSIIFDDTNFDANGINVTLTGARVDNHNHPFTRTVTQFGSVVTFSDFARVKESDDIYTAKATITDLAGNTAEATVRFSVNRFGSTFDFNDDEPTIDLVNGYYAQETDNVIIREVNVNKLTGYTLTVNRDGSNITLVEGEDFRVISSAIAGGYQYIYEIFPEVFTSEGTYSIIVQSVDEAGNTNTNSTVRTDDGVNDYPVVFAIDKTLPTVSIDELDPDDRSNNNFNENSKTFRISVRDNNAMSRVIVTVDGNVVFDMEGQELAEYLEEHGGFVEITLDAASGYQTIKVQAFDGAGNESADTQYQVLVTTNFFVRFFYNKPLFYGSIIFLILLLLAIAYYIKKRMDKQKKNA